MSDLATLKKEFDALSAKREAIQAKTAPLKAEREALFAQAAKFNDKVPPLTDEINRINLADDLIGISKRRGQIADAMMAVRELTKK
jgi:uncharacterized coiled-coil DUF342 family protein